MYITFRTRKDEWNNIFYKARAYIMTSTPEVGDLVPDHYKCEIVSVYPITIDPEQGGDEIWNYSFYKVEFKHLDDEEAENDVTYIAVENEPFEEEEYEEEGE